MKKIIIPIVALCSILILCLTGCSSTLKPTTIADTQEKWDNAIEKEATDIITIKNFNFAKAIIVENATITLNRKLKNGITTIDFSVNDLKVKFSSSANIIVNNVLGMFPELNISDIEQLKLVLDNLEEFKGNITLSENNTKLDFSVTTKVNYRIPTYDKTESSSVTIDYNTPYGNILKQALALITSHYSAIFEPTTDGAKINPEKLNSLVKSTIEYIASTDSNNSVNDINAQIKSILGVSYSQFINEKVQIENTTSVIQIKSKYISKMTLGFNNIKLLYNKKQFVEMLSKLIKLLDPNNSLVSFIGMLENYLKDITEGISCIQIERIGIKSTYKIRK